MFSVSPIKGKYHFIKGYTVVKIANDYTKTVEHTFQVDADFSIDDAYAAAADLAALMNSAPVVC
jgi:hypothetical protein